MADSREGKDIRVVHLTDLIEVFRDPETEQVSEGYALVWEILEDTEDFYVLRVSFMSDPQAPGRKFIRKYKKKKP